MFKRYPTLKYEQCDLKYAMRSQRARTFSRRSPLSHTPLRKGLP